MSVSFGLASIQGMAVVDDAEHRRAGDPRSGRAGCCRPASRCRRSARARTAWSRSRCAWSSAALACTIGRKLLDRQIGIAEQLVERGCCAAARRIAPAIAPSPARRSRCRDRPATRSSWRASAVLRSTSRCLSSMVFCARSTSLVQRGQIGLEVGEVGAHAVELALRLATASRNGTGSISNSTSPGADVLAFAHGDARDLAGDVGRDQHLLGAHIGVVGRDVAAAHEVERAARSVRRSAATTTSRMRRMCLRNTPTTGFSSVSTRGASGASLSAVSAIVLFHSEGTASVAGSPCADCL